MGKTVTAVDPRHYREQAWQRLCDEVFDLLVIGGGINGAAVARDAALRGISVAVIERSDFASGTSSRSSKLIHGGVRYLQHGDIALVLEACRERDLLRSRTAPHLVRGQPFVFPIYDDDDLALWELRAGLIAYDTLAAFRNVENHSMLDREALMKREPALATDGLQGGAFYYDCWTDDARLTLETMLSARSEGATVLNYAEVAALDKDSTGRLATAEVNDLCTGLSTRVRARFVLNVAGPWLDRIRRLDDAGTPPRLRLTKGVHAVFPRSAVGNNDAIVIRGYEDNRVMFAIPWQDLSLVGTTDTYFDGDPASVSADKDDIDYLLASVHRAFPNCGAKASNIISTYAGLRPLVAPEDEMEESDVSREDQIFESPAGLFSLGGGKLTTHRHVAERIVNAVAGRLGRSVGRCRTRKLALPAAKGMEPGNVAVDVPDSIEEHLKRRYGAIAVDVMQLIREDESLGEPLVDDAWDCPAEVLHAVYNEMSVTLADVMIRRLGVHLRSRHNTRDVAERVAIIMGGVHGWDEARRSKEVEAYLRLVEASTGAAREFVDIVHETPRPQAEFRASGQE